MAVQVVSVPLGARLPSLIVLVCTAATPRPAKITIAVPEFVNEQADRVIFDLYCTNNCYSEITSLTRSLMFKYGRKRR
ncbi:hypothetical protein GGI43DRAFT_403756 [Trichoderma evansii]